MKVLISETLFKKLQSKPEKNDSSIGFLCGVNNDDDILITGCLQNNLEQSSQNQEEIVTNLQQWLPGGVTIVGTFGTTAPIFHSHQLSVHLKIEYTEEDFEETKIFGILNDQDLPSIEIVVKNDEELESLFLDTHIYFQVIGSTVIRILDKSVGLVNLDTIDEETKPKVAFFIPSIKQIVKTNTKDSRILNQVFKTIPSSNFNKNNRILSQATLYEAFAADDVSSNTQNPIAPYFKNINSGKLLHSLSITLKANCFVNKQTKMKKLSEVLENCLHNLKKAVLNSHKLVSMKFSSNTMSIPEFNDFYLPGWLHPITICYPANKPDEALADYRKNVLHSTFMQSTRIPVFRRGNAIHLSEEFEVSTRLKNPHIGLKDPDMPDVQIALVNGNYRYFHYKQDGIDDTGWGCAYRSLQTIISWYRLQGFTNLKVPSHQMIQQTLVSIGDKPHRFVLSNSWIGSIEVSKVLQSYLGIDSKIINISQGSSITSKARELIRHFRKSGTPVMIGSFLSFIDLLVSNKSF